MKIFELEQLLDKRLNIELAEEWDNVGLLLGKKNEEVNSIYLTLEVTEKTLDEAISSGANFIISHHPFIFSKLKKIIDSENNLIFKAIENNIAIYSAHTNFDIIKNGLNDYFADIFDKNHIPLVKENGDYLRIFKIKEQSVEDFAEVLKLALGIENVRLIGDKNKKITNVGVVTGAGGDFVKDAFSQGADIFITGDIKYHEAMYFYEKNMTVLDIGHFDSEKIFFDAMKKFIECNIKELDMIKIYVSSKEQNPFSFL